MKRKNLSKALVLTTLASAFALGCELIVDFDRTRIPAEGADATVPDATTPADTGAPETGPPADDAGSDAADDASDAEADADAQ